MGFFSRLFGSGAAFSETAASARDHDPAFAHELSNVYHGTRSDRAVRRRSAEHDGHQSRRLVRCSGSFVEQ